MREQFGEPVHRMGSDARQHITEPSERLDPAVLASCDEAQLDGRGVAAIVAAERCPLSTASDDIAIGRLGRSVVDFQNAVFQLGSHSVLLPADCKLKS
jgi:hypothetical protein